MTNEQRLLQLAQRIYRTMNKTSNQNIDGADLTTFIDDTIGWVNDFLPELENETYDDGTPVYWNFLRQNDYIVDIATDAPSYILADAINTLVVDANRPLTLRHDGTVVASFKLVNPNQLNDPSDYDIVDRATVLGNRLVLSRSLTEEEQGADIVADAILHIPELSREDVSLLDIVKPLQLIVLGTAKNWILPDKVSGGLSPSFAQKYDILLEKVKRLNRVTSQANRYDRESFSDIGGIGF